MVWRARDSPAELAEFEHDQGRPRARAGDLDESINGLRREIPQQLRVLDGPHRIHRVHANSIHRRVGHDPESVHDRLAETLAHGTEEVLAVLGRFPTVATADRYDRLAAQGLGEERKGRDVEEGYPRGHLVRQTGAPAGVPGQYFPRLLDRIEDVTAVEARHRVEIEH